MKNKAHSLIVLLFGFILINGITSSFADSGKDAAVKQVKAAIEFAKANGKDAVISAINSDKFHDGELYVTVYDLTGTCLAHIKPEFVGQNQLNRKDPAGVAYIKERIDGVKAKNSIWTKYKFMNPVTKKLEDKEMYSELSDDLIYSAGAYFKK